MHGDSNVLYRRRAALGRLAALAGAACAAAGPVRAADFPARPITLVVPYAPGATTDTLGRAVAEIMSRKLDTPVLVDNKAGANGIIGATFVSNAAADGYTILFSSDSSNVLNPLLYSKLRYDPDRDLKPLTLLSDLPVVLVVDARLPIQNLAEFVQYARANPNAVNYGSTGNGGTFHLAGELFAQQAGIRMTHVPYKGGAPAIAGMLGGETQALFGVIGSNLPYLKAGKLRAIALAGRQRMAVLPGVPTFAEQGYPDFVVLVRYGLSVPAATPPAVVATLNDAAQVALADPEFRKKFEAQGFVVPARSGPAEFKAVIESDKVLWRDLIKRKGITLD
ncbi:tripartite tricarboxylate transporter substrate binding protein [Xylophilus sp. Kf1]|nr:tripartite tricarboxylate transporter substrate binding protein [Xylophilus sp. Kf1]